MGKFYVSINDGPSFPVESDPAVIFNPGIPVMGQPISGPLLVEQPTPEIIIQEKLVEKPVEVIREVVVEKIVEVPVEKIVEVEKKITVVEVQKVEVPVEVIKEIEVPVEIEKLVIRDVVHKDVTSIVIFSILALMAGIIIGRI
jgi:hypothetical protein